MSIITSGKKGQGSIITVSETDITCPICTFKFDASDKMDKAKLPVFKMKCPGCKSAIGIQIPIFGGVTKYFEWNPPKTKEDHQLKTASPFRVNGKIVTKKLYDDNSDDDQNEEILM